MTQQASGATHEELLRSADQVELAFFDGDAKERDRARAGAALLKGELDAAGMNSYDRMNTLVLLAAQTLGEDTRSVQLIQKVSGVFATAVVNLAEVHAVRRTIEERAK